MLRFEKEIYLSLLFIFLSVGLSISLRGLKVLLLSEFVNIVSILYYIEFSIFLFTFLVISFAQDKEYDLTGFI